MNFLFKASRLASSISVMTVAVGLVFGPLSNQKSLAQTVINGAGSSFVAPLYEGVPGSSFASPSGSWFAVYGAPSPAVNPNVRFNYDAVGSGAGIDAFNGLAVPGVTTPVSFGASDAPLTDPGRSRPSSSRTTGRGLPIQVPTVAGAIALTYNAQGLNVPAGGLKLSRATYCGILNGNITNWNDQRITADNGRQLSSGLPIKAVVRRDSSGSTFVLSNHLNTVCTSPFNWNRGVGTTVNWPASFLKVEGSSGIVSTVRSNRGAIGYVDNSQRLANAPVLPAALLQKQSGSAFLAPTAGATSAALAGAKDQNADPRIITINVPNPIGATAYPIVGVSYLVFYDIYNSVNTANGIKGFINWALGTQAADNIATQRGYAPISTGLSNSATNVVQTYVDTAPN